MDEPPVIIIILVGILSILGVSFIYLGGTALIMFSSWVPMKTRLRWAALSLMPLALLAIALAITAVTIGKNAAGSDADDSFLVAFTPVGFVAGLLVVGVIASNWLIFRRFRVALPRNSNSPTS